MHCHLLLGYLLLLFMLDKKWEGRKEREEHNRGRSGGADTLALFFLSPPLHFFFFWHVGKRKVVAKRKLYSAKTKKKRENEEIGNLRLGLFNYFKLFGGGFHYITGNPCFILLFKIMIDLNSY